jgi:hypothetical protein
MMFSNRYCPTNPGSRKSLWRALLSLPFLGLLFFSGLAAYGAPPALMPPHPNLIITPDTRSKLASLHKGTSSLNRPAPITTAVTGTRGVIILTVDFSDQVANAGNTKTFTGRVYVFEPEK